MAAGEPNIQTPKRRTLPLWNWNGAGNVVPITMGRNDKDSERLSHLSTAKVRGVRFIPSRSAITISYFSNRLLCLLLCLTILFICHWSIIASCYPCHKTTKKGMQQENSDFSLALQFRGDMSPSFLHESRTPYPLHHRLVLFCFSSFMRLKS